MGTFYYCDLCMFCGPETVEATHLDVKLWNGKTEDLCDTCYELRKQQGDLSQEELEESGDQSLDNSSIKEAKE